MVQKPWQLLSDDLVGAPDDLFLRIVRTGGNSQRPTAERRLEPFEFAYIHDGRRRVDLEIAERLDVPPAHLLKCAPHRIVLREHEVEA